MNAFKKHFGKFTKQQEVVGVETKDSVNDMNYRLDNLENQYTKVLEAIESMKGTLEDLSGK